MAGLLILHHKKPHAYTEQEIRLLSTIGILVGSEIEIERLEDCNSDLLYQLETRKLVERGKGILQRSLGLSEEEAYLALQRQSRQKKRSMREIAEAIILGDEVKRGSLAS